MQDVPCIAAGFFVAKLATRYVCRSVDLPTPRQRVSLSPCVADSYRVYWGWEVEKNRAESGAFGFPEEHLPDLHPWENDHGISFPNVFHSLEDTRDFVATFLPGRHDFMILGAALPTALVDEFLVDHKQRCYYPETDTYTDSLDGVNLVLTARRALPDGGERLGFELVAFESHLCCSWLCSGADGEITAALNIEANQHGLIETCEDALRADAWLQEHPGVGEGGPFYPWLIVRYPLSVE